MRCADVSLISSNPNAATDDHGVDHFGDADDGETASIGRPGESPSRLPEPRYRAQMVIRLSSYHATTILIAAPRGPNASEKRTGRYRSRMIGSGTSIGTSNQSAVTYALLAWTSRVSTKPPRPIVKLLSIMTGAARGGAESPAGCGK